MNYSFSKHFFLNLLRTNNFFFDRQVIGNIGVALYQSRNRTKPAKRRSIKLPNRVRNRLIMRVDQNAVCHAMTRQMKLSYLVNIDAVQICGGIVAMIDRADVNVVDVEQEPTTRTLCDFREKLPLRHFRMSERQIARNIFKEHLSSESILNLVNPSDHVIDRFLGKREW